MSSSTTKCVIRIDENGPRIESNGNSIASDLKLTLKDFLPSVTNWTTWNGTLQEGDEINITTPYKFIAVRARNLGTSGGSTISPPTGLDFTSACLPANNSLASNCGCGSSSESSDEVLLDFEINQYTTYTLDSKNIYSNNSYIFDCSHGSTAYGVTGWTGCDCNIVDDCGCTGATGATGATASFGATCNIGATASAKGVYTYIFTAVLRNNQFVIKSDEAESTYKCKLDYYAYVKADDNKLVFVFDDTHGKWVIVRLDEKINDIIANNISYNVIELIEWSESNYTYKNSNITMPSEIGYTGTNSYTGSVSELDLNMPVVFKINSLLIMESKTFTGKITSRLNNLDVNVMLAV